MKRKASDRFPIVGLELAPEIETDIDVEGQSFFSTMHV